MTPIVDAVASTDCTVVAINVAIGEEIRAGATMVIVEMMKMEHLVVAPESGIIASVEVSVGEVLRAGQTVATIELRETQPVLDEAEDLATGFSRADLGELLGRQKLLSDEARPEAVAKIHGRKRRTARENLADLVDADSFEEYGGFMYAGQTRKRDLDDLIANTPGDGIVGGLARVNGDQFGPEASACAVMSYDYTVLAGTQGFRGHQKKDRLLEIVDRLGIPVILFAEGGGGRPGDTDQMSLAGLEIMSFAWMARLSGKAPSIAIVSGRCFAGNAALAAVCDVIIATPDANLGMAGPAMIEGGGLGVFTPEEIGPVDVQTTNGVIDILADDESSAVALAKQYLAFFQGTLADWHAHDQSPMRDIVPENRKRIYEVREAIRLLCDIDSTLELRPTFGNSVVTTLGRLEGSPIAILANDPAHLGGAIDSDSADKAARFMQLCDGHRLPLVVLCDTPGFMVGPDAERSAQVRHFGRMFVAGASLTIPTATVLLRKAVGLGAMAMSGGSFHSTLLTMAWPTGEISGMGIEGAVTLGARRQLEAIVDPEERQTTYEELVARQYSRSKALNAAAHNEVDDVIDPATTRSRLINLFRSTPEVGRPSRPMIDTW